MLADTRDRAVLCIEEPENGMHPSRVPILVDLFRDYAFDGEFAVDDHNPLRQVVLNTHSPEVARQLSFEDLVFVQRAYAKDKLASAFRPIDGTWRTNLDDGSCAPPLRRQAVADFVGGSPVNQALVQVDFDFGSAR